jgi:hypothetical protein
MIKRTGLLLMAAVVGAFCLEAGEKMSIPGIHGVVSPAQAIVGRPGTPRSVAGVARRTYRRSDMMLKHDISLVGHLDNGLGFYRFSYNDSDKAYVGVMAQEVQTVMPAAVVRGRDGYLLVNYDKLGLSFQTYDQWVASGAHVPAGAPARH